MGIEVSAQKVVTINDQHENGVDTSVDGKPSRGRFKGIAYSIYSAAISGDSAETTVTR